MEAVSTPRLRVLCVDDNQDSTDSAVEYLRLMGFDAVACYDGAGALAAAGEFVPDVCLLDLNMPGMNGDELAGRLRDQAAGRAILFIAVTAQSDDDSRRRTADAGFKLHLVKPVDPHHILRIMEALGHLLDGAADRPPEAVNRHPPHPE
jgi:two-component system OmpR family response regulator